MTAGLPPAPAWRKSDCKDCLVFIEGSYGIRFLLPLIIQRNREKAEKSRASPGFFVHQILHGPSDRRKAGYQPCSPLCRRAGYGFPWREAPNRKVSVADDLLSFQSLLSFRSLLSLLTFRDLHSKLLLFICLLDLRQLFL